jgi:signal transduction histidine kinase
LLATSIPILNPGAENAHTVRWVGGLPAKGDLFDRFEGIVEPARLRYTGAVTETTRGLRLALALGFGGMLAIFLVAAGDAIRLLGHMREENKIRNEASLDRSHRLATIRSYVVLSQGYVGDYFTDPDAGQARRHQDELEQTWARVLSGLADYHTGSDEETASIVQLRDMLDREGQELRAAMVRRQRLAFFPMRAGGMIEITTRVADVDARQLAAAEADNERQFEEAGSRLGFVLQIAIGSAILLAIGCILYILRIEGQNRRRYLETVEARAALEKLSARLVSAQEEERRSISRELHDEVGQTLTAVMVDAANLANRLPQDDAVSRKYLENIRSYADRSVNSIRNIALLLRPSMLDDLGLVPALEWQAREISRRSGIQIKVTAENVPEALPDPVRTCVYRVVQEALTNISRHAGAKNAVVSVRYSVGTLNLKIEDDGNGFDPVRTKGMGLLGMDERVKQLGGRFEVRSKTGEGTTITVNLPVDVTEPARL